MSVFRRQSKIVSKPEVLTPSQTKALAGFEKCPNNIFRSFGEQGKEKLEVVCAQYPFGTSDIVAVSSDYIGNEEVRARIGQKLGCATCRFGNELLERVDTQRFTPDGSIEVEVRFTPALQRQKQQPGT